MIHEYTSMSSTLGNLTLLATSLLNCGYDREFLSTFLFLFYLIKT